MAGAGLADVTNFRVFAVGDLTEENGALTLGIKVFGLRQVAFFILSGAGDVSRGIHILGLVLRVPQVAFDFARDKVVDRGDELVRILIGVV